MSDEETLIDTFNGLYIFNLIVALISARLFQRGQFDMESRLVDWKGPVLPLSIFAVRKRGHCPHSTIGHWLFINIVNTPLFLKIEG
ncbi:hypothetical protein SCHPADRAFT_940755 [Schizopora paradoxa]|uniref:Uncharacterized protein n=1 Tax=Schizopora paradoxa TaxID=27342 RepID=A0A0H2RN24_9AGAM|nr:hypothetical protein SCHPADRAFT_940755 [Schizopora paradoxa]